jgi:hypothetical protein
MCFENDMKAKKLYLYRMTGVYDNFFFVFHTDDHKLGPRAKLFRVRLCDSSTQVVSVVHIFRLERLKKEQHPLRLFQSLPPQMYLIGVPHSVSVNLKSIPVAAFPRQIFRNPTIHSPLSHSPVNRRRWDFSGYRSVPDDS